MTATWVEVNEARALPGVKLVLTKGIPNPWAHGAKALLDVKRIPYTRVPQRGLTPNAELLEHRDWIYEHYLPLPVELR